MTQIATTIGLATGTKAAGIAGAIGSGRGMGMKPGAASDFAALAAGLGLSSDAGASADPEGLALGEATGAETGADSDKDSDAAEGKAGEPVILDLALGAAALGAMTPVPVAVQQGQASAPLVAGQAAVTSDPSLAAITGDAKAVAPGRGLGGPVDRGAVLPPALLVSDGKDGAVDAAAAVAVEATAPRATSSPDTAASAPTTKVLGKGKGKAVAEMAKLRQPAADNSAPTQLAAVVGVGTAPAVSAVSAASTGALPAVAVGGSAAAPVAGSAATKAATAAPEGFSPTSDGGQGASSARPLDPSRRPTIDAAMLRQAAAILSSSPMPVVDGETVVSADPIDAILPAVVGNEKTAGRNAVRTTLDGVASAVPTPEKTAYGAQSILSTLHRATVAEGESKTDTATTTSPAASLSVVGAVARRDSGQASDQSADRDTGGSLRGDDARPGAIAPEVTAGGSQYADILQNL
ncbi:MAG: hypothetical protein ABW039_08500, partial [Sphingobium sp.]